MFAKLRPMLAASPVASACLLGIVYLVVAAVTVRYTRFEGGVAFVWPASGLLVGALVATDRARWPLLLAACAIASFAATSTFGLGPGPAAPLALVNVGEALLGAWLVQRLCPRCADLASIGEILVVLALSAVLAPAVTGLAGAGVAAAVTQVGFWHNWLTWVSGHALGTVILAPLVILALRGDVAGWVRDADRGRRIEAVALVTTLVATTVVVFAQSRLPLLFVPFLPMMIAVFRLGRLGATLSVAVLAVVGIVFTVRGLGPIALVAGGEGLRAQVFQLYLATAALMVLPAAGELKRRKEVTRELEEQATLHQLILDRTGDVIMTLEVDGRIRFASPSIRRILGREPESLRGAFPHSFIHADDVGRVIAAHREALDDPERTFIVDYRVIDGGREIGWFEAHIRATVDGEGRPSGAVNVIRDVTERKGAEARLAAAALVDPLTGVANRRAFDTAVAARRDARPGRPAALAIFDLDRFKAVNDTYGHAAGDHVLRAFADVLRGAVRDRDVVARLGGEEFVAIIEGADLDAARAVCERVRERFAALDVTLDDGTIIRATVSAGMAPMSPLGTADAALAAADAALYRAKAAGRNRLAMAG